MIDSDTLKSYTNHVLAGEERLQVAKTQVEANHVPMFRGSAHPTHQTRCVQLMFGFGSANRAAPIRVERRLIRKLFVIEW
jgi:hypothetical protein